MISKRVRTKPTELNSGYKQLGCAFKDGVTVYRVKITEPDKRNGMACDALIFVNGHWRWFPKPYRVLNLQ